ncbi:MAG TPA: AfsR/SARP family transcriptional regulator [Solirubrobacteraceae bacterium]|nr:AfsR/SARP family transcriptional regulator [Solirubrobacteraceae bacterium]
MATTDFRILGPLEVVEEGQLVPLAGARQRALLAILLLHAGEAISSDRLIDELWGEEPPDAGSAALRVRISQLRRALGPAGELLVTRPPGYALALAPEQVDLRRFERLVEEGDRALGREDPAAAVDSLREALALWRGPPLADFSYAPFAQGAIVRLDELRLAAIELRVEAELALGDHARVVGELQALVREHPMRERLCGQLMLALYRDGRQTDALEAYRTARARLVEEIGLEPGPELHDLERRILAQDEGLMIDRRPRAAPARAILVLVEQDATLDPLVGLASDLAARGDHELVIAALVDDDGQLAARAARLNDVRAVAAQRGVIARVAAFTSADAGADAVRLAGEEDVALLLLDAPEALLDGAVPTDDLAGLLAQSPCDVALVAGAQRRVVAPEQAVMVPFGGHQHDWAAVELGAWFAASAGVPLQLIGTRIDPSSGRRDASRLLGHASLALQRGLGITAEPVLVDPGTDAIVAAADRAALVVVGLSDRFAGEGLGSTRTEMARRAAAPVVFVRRGLRPGGLAPPRALTRFTWSAG